MNPTTAGLLAAALAEQAEIRRMSESPPIAPGQTPRKSTTRDLFETGEPPAPGPFKADDAPAAITLDDFVAYLPSHSYIFKPTGEFWPKESVNSNIRPLPLFDADGNPVIDERTKKQKAIAAATWLDKNHSVQQITWAPGEPMEVHDRLVSEGGWYESPNRTTFNLYRQSEIRPRAGEVSPWLDHIRRVFGEEAAGHIVCWLAHRVQRPGDKVNHALVLGGNPGIGKDTILEPVKEAVGPWNFTDIGPGHLFESFNGWVKSVILRINEVHNLGDVNRYGFYEASKIYTAAPPATIPCNEKHKRQHAVFNIAGVIMSTNHLSGGMYLPANDRRHYVCWSDLTAADFSADYFKDLYAWFAAGGNEAVAHYLTMLDLSGFDAKAPPPKTAAFWAIVDASRAPEDSEMADALDRLGRPPAVTLEAIRSKAALDFNDWLRDRKNRVKIPHRLKECGYDPVRNPDDARDGQWKIGDKRQTVYVLRELSVCEQLIAAAALSTAPAMPPMPS